MQGDTYDWAWMSKKSSAKLGMYISGCYLTQAFN